MIPEMVRISQVTGFCPQGNSGPYMASTRSHRLSGGEDVLGRIVVTVVGRTARLARPFTDGQGHGIDDTPATRAHLARRKPAIDLDRRFPVHRGLSLDRPNSHADSDIAQAAGKAVILDHAAQVQVFEVDHIEPANEINRQLLGRVLATVADLLMDAGDPTLGQEASPRALLFASQLPLCLGQPPGARRQMAWIADSLAGRERCQPVDAKVDTDLGASHRQGLYVDLDDETDKPATTRLADDRGCGRRARHRPVPAHLHAADLGEGECSVLPVELECRERVGRRIVLAFTTKGWIARSLGEEVAERSLELAQRLLQRHRRNFVQPRSFGLPLEDGHGPVTVSVGHSLPFLEGARSFGQSPIIDIAAAAERARQRLLLFGRRVAPIGPSLIHVLHIGDALCKIKPRFLPGLNAGAPTGEFR